MNKEYDFLTKIVIIGNSNVGKSSLLVRFSDDTFNENYMPTIGVDFRFKTIKLNGHTVKLQIWDTAGQERFRTITNAYYKGADGIVMVYDVTDPQSFKDIETYWLNEVQQYAEKKVVSMIMGNKMDMEEDRKVLAQQAANWAQDRGILAMETSARLGSQVDTAFNAIAEKILEGKLVSRLQEKKKKREKNDTPTPNDTPDNTTQGQEEPLRKLRLGEKIKEKAPERCQQC